MRGRIPLFVRLKKAQMKIVRFAKYGFLASTAFSQKFKFKFVCCLYLMFFLYSNEKLIIDSSECPFFIEGFVIINMLNVFNCYLTVYITWKLIVFKNLRQFFTLAVFLVFFVYLILTLICSDSITFLAKYK